MQIKFQRGVLLPEHDLWLDPHDDRSFAFVSHAHSDHIGRHRESVLSTATARLMNARLGAPGDSSSPQKSRRQHVLDFHQPAGNIRPGLRFTLLPAGHILGSAMLFLEDLRGAGDGESLLYTGDFKLRHGLSAEPAETCRADTLIMETTFGLPKFRFPPTEQVLADIIKFCQDAMEDDAVPVLFGYSLGKGQEIIAALHRAGLSAVLHGAVHRMTEIVRTLRPDFPPAERYAAGADLQGKVLICPPSANHSRMLQKIPAVRTAMLTGWAMNPGAHFRYQTDTAFPLSDHADYPDLLRLVELVRPQRVLTLHGYAAAFARDLRERGIEAWALSEENQLDLALGTPPPAPPARADNTPTGGTADGPSPSSIVQEAASEGPASSPALATSSAFSGFVGVCEAMAGTTGKLKKIEFLAEYFRALDDESLPIAALYLAGRAFAQNDPRVLNVGGSVVRRALLAASGVPEARYRELSAAMPDQGETTLVLLGERDKREGRTPVSDFTLVESHALLSRLAAARGPLIKTEILQEAIVRLPAAEARYVVKILGGELRIGLKEGLLEEALAAAFARPADAIREANMLLGDLGKVALLARADRLAEAELTLFQPIKSMLASPEPTAEAIWARHEEVVAGIADPGLAGDDANEKSGISDPGCNADAPRTVASSSPVVWIEDKFDGVRAQLHRAADGRVEIYSRDLRRVTAQFDEIARAASATLPGVEAIFDGEIVAWQEGKKLTFFDLQKRLGRREADLFMQETIPLSFFAFDLLRLGDRALLGEPLATRRALLETLPLRAPLRVVEVTQAASAEEIEATFHAARGRSNEGLIVKDPQSLYTPGRRGLAWLKLKKELATLDVVIVGAEWGHGKRNHVLSDYTFAVRDAENGDELVTIGKAYSGLTDAEIAEMTTQLQAATLSTRGKYHAVRPEIVLEIAFDSIQPSSRHTSGLALRFPRIKAIRHDKTATEIDTVEYARSLV